MHISPLGAERIFLWHHVALNTFANPQPICAHDFVGALSCVRNCCGFAGVLNFLIKFVFEFMIPLDFKLLFQHLMRAQCGAEVLRRRPHVLRLLCLLVGENQKVGNRCTEGVPTLCLCCAFKSMRTQGGEEVSRGRPFALPWLCFLFDVNPLWGRGGQRAPRKMGFV